jgi:hypothetical protein
MRSSLRPLVLLFALVTVVAGLAACGGDDDSGGAGTTVTNVAVVPQGTDPRIQGVQLYSIGKYTHVDIGTTIAYVDHPPVGGTHWYPPGWVTCGFYDAPIPDEGAVHDLEHGVVWIAYQQTLPAADLGILKQLARTDEHLLVAPYPNLRAPLVATAWGAQLDLQQAGDALLVQFIAAYTNASAAPEAGASCASGQATKTKPVDLGD